MAKQVIETRETGSCSECIHAIKDRNQEVIGCRNGLNNPCCYEEREF